MEDTWIAILGGVITTILSGFSSWFFTKKKYNAEVDNNLITGGVDVELVSKYKKEICNKI